MNKFFVFVVAFFMCSTSIAYADQEKNAKKSQTIEAKVLAEFKKRYPATSVATIRKSEISGLFEVTMGSNIAYTDENAKYLVFGHIFDVATQTDLTQARLDQVNKIDFAKLPLEKSIKVVKGDGSREFAVFTDPDCPYCKRLESELEGLDNYTMYVFLFPIAGLHPEAEAHANAIWCAKNRVVAWHEYMLNNKLSEEKSDCITPIRELGGLGQSLGVQGTPTLFRKDGMRVPGVLPPQQLDAWLSGKSIQTGR